MKDQCQKQSAKKNAMKFEFAVWFFDSPDLSN